MSNLQQQFRRFYDRTHGKLYNFYLQATKNSELSKDLTQNAYMELWLKFDTVQSSHGTRSAYLYTIAKRLMIRQIKERIRENEKLLAFRHSLVSNHMGVNNDLDDQINELHRAISELPERQKQVFTLAKLEKKPHKEIARELSISISTVEKHVMSAMNHLKKALKSDILTFFL